MIKKKIVLAFTPLLLLVLLIPIESEADLLTSTNVNGKTLVFQYTDDNRNEDLIIRTTQETYYGFDQASIYSSVTNISPQNQSVNLQVYFNKPTESVTRTFVLIKDISFFVTVNDFGFIEHICKTNWKQVFYESTDYVLHGCQDTNEEFMCDSIDRNVCIENNGFLGTHQEERFKDKWQPLEKLTQTDSRDKREILGKLIPSDYTAREKNTNIINVGETKFFRFDLKFPQRTTNEFYIEAVGSVDGYGLLDPFYNSDWLNRKAITINSTEVNSDLINFPILLNFTDTDLRDDAQDDGDDILFTNFDNTTKLSHEIEQYTNTTGYLTAWVNVNVTSATDTIIYMYYNNPLATNQEDITGTWNTNFQGVYHIHDDFLDSTSNSNDGTNLGMVDSLGNIADGEFGDGTFDDFDITDIAALEGVAEYTGCLWYNVDDNTDTFDAFLGEFVSGTNKNIISFGWGGSGGTDNYLAIMGNGADRYGYTSGNLITANEWNNVCMVFNGTEALSADRLKIYHNGTQASLTFPLGLPPATTPSNAIAMHVFNDNGVQRPEGDVDEVRVLDYALSSDWIAFEWCNQQATSFINNTDSTVLCPAWMIHEEETEFAILPVFNALVIKLNPAQATTLGGVFTGTCTGTDKVSGIDSNGDIICMTDTTGSPMNSSASPTNDGALYMIYTNTTDGLVKALNTTSGVIDYSNADFVTVLESAMNNLTPNRTWKELVTIIGDQNASSTIDIPSYTTIEIRGKVTLEDNTDDTFFQNSNADSYTTLSNNDIEIFGGEIDGNKDNNAVGPSGGDETHTIRIKNVTNVHIHDMKIVNGWTSAIRTSFSENILIGNNYILNAADDGVAFNEDSFFGVIVGNLIEDSGQGKSYGSPNGIEVQDGAHDVSVFANIIKNPLTSGLQASTHGGADTPYEMVFSGNTISGGTIGINLDGDPLEMISNVTITNNHIHDTGDTGIFMEFTEKVLIMGNSIIEAADKGIQCFQAGSGNIAIINNLIKGATASSIQLEATCDQNIVMGNTIIDSNGYGINVVGQGDILTNNVMIDTRAVPSMDACFRLQAGSSNTLIMGNICTNPVSAQPISISSLATNYTIYNNVWNDNELETEKQLIGEYETFEFLPSDATLDETTPPALVQNNITWVSYFSLDFDDTTEEMAYWQMNFPRDMNAQMDMGVEIMFQVPTATGGICFDVAFLTIDEGQVMNSGLGTTRDACDTSLTAGVLQILEVNTPIAHHTVEDGQFVVLRVDRDVANASDDMVGDVKLLAVRLYWHD